MTIKPTTVTASVHVNDDTPFVVDNFLDSTSEFISINVGGVNLFLMSLDHAEKLLAAARTAVDTFRAVQVIAVAA